MSTNRYFDSEERSRSSASSGNRGGNGDVGSSYTDRFRVDAPGRVNRYAGRPSSHATASEKLRSMIESACRPTLLEPDWALSLDITDLINAKKGNLPREAAMQIVKLVNSITPHVPILAMSLLDICVKNCGYPFHLQISRKEFLNELVKKFPERPPMNYSREQVLILEAIEEWRQTLCRTSKYKDDFGYIRDMHRLLTYKGYIFPEINRDDAAVLNPSDTLKSPQELEEEERDAQSAKLEELLRRGTPADLQEANHLMSIMAGFRESKTDYRAKAAKDLDKVRRKAEILEEMLTSVDPAHGITETDDVFTEIISALKNARPKIQKMIDEEGETDEQALVRLLALNDYLSALIQKYDLIKAGKYDEATNVSVVPVSGSLESRKKVDTSSKAAITQSLIDIDDDEPSNTATDAANSTNSANSAPEDLIGGLLDLSFDSGNKDSNYGAGGNISLGLSTSASPAPQQTSLVGDFGVGTSPQKPEAKTAAHATDYSALEALSSPRSSTPGTPGISDFSKPASNLDLFSNMSSPTQGHKTTASGGDEWNFLSAGPISSQATATPKAKLELLNTALTIEGQVYQENGTSSLRIDLLFKNNSKIQAINQLNFQVAVPKSYLLKLEPQSGVTIPANSTTGVTQVAHITHVPTATTNTSFAKLKLRWKVHYSLGTNPIDEDGTISSIPNVA